MYNKVRPLKESQYTWRRNLLRCREMRILRKLAQELNLNFSGS